MEGHTRVKFWLSLHQAGGIERVCRKERKGQEGGLGGGAREREQQNGVGWDEFNRAVWRTQILAFQQHHTCAVARVGVHYEL